MQSNAMQYNTKQPNAIEYNIIQCNEMYTNETQCSALYLVTQCNTMEKLWQSGILQKQKSWLVKNITFPTNSSNDWRCFRVSHGWPGVVAKQIERIQKQKAGGSNIKPQCVGYNHQPWGVKGEGGAHKDYSGKWAALEKLLTYSKWNGMVKYRNC